MKRRHPERSAAKSRDPVAKRRKGDAARSAGSSRDDLWRGLSSDTRRQLRQRDYATSSLGKRLARAGVEAGPLFVIDRNAAEIAQVWIPGVEIFPRTIHPQRHRGSFAELVRRDEGVLRKIGLWPRQWAAARMFAQTAKGFHIHPPKIPPNELPNEWFRRLFIDERENFSLRLYAEEQWDVMFFIQGRAEMILRDARAGMPPRTMRLFIDGDNHRGLNNAAIVIPPGVAHALRVEGSEDLIMVYGTSTIFQADYEGRIASEIENAPLPTSWQKFLA